MNNEIWKDIYYTDIITGEIVDFRGCYQVSNLGRIKSLKRITSQNHLIKEKILKVQKKNNGYLYVGLHKDGIFKNFHIHRLVAYMFIENNDKENRIFINHKDENKENNCFNNLEWCTHEYNQNYGTKNERISKIMKEKELKGKNNPNYGKHLSNEIKQKISESLKEKFAGKNNPRAKRVAQYDLEGNLIRIWDYVKQVTEEFGWDNSTICKCCNGKQKTAYGYIWKYVSE